MALTPNLSKVRVTGFYVDPLGQVDTGVIRFTLSTILTDPNFNQIITNAPITVQLVDGQIFSDGHVGIDLVATNDPDLYPSTGVFWKVDETVGGISRSYQISLDYRWATFDLADRFTLTGDAGTGSGSNGGGSGTTNPGTGTGSGTVAPHAATHAVGGSDPLTPFAIGAASVDSLNTLTGRVSTDEANITALTNRVTALESSAPTVATVPGSPTNVTATAGDSRITVTFQPPASNGGAPITGYRVGVSNGVVVTAASSPIVVTNLSNGTAYYLSVVAINSAGTSDASTVVGPVTPLGSSVTAPGAPTNVQVVASASQAVVSFTPPTNNGGGTIISYRVTASSGQTATGASSPITVTGLPNGTPVNFTVVAINSAGSSTASNPSSYVTPVTVPDAPTTVAAIAGDGQAAVSWTAPANTGGAAVIDYTVTASTGQTSTGSGSPLTVGGLMNGTGVTFTVRARNSAGLSAASASSGPVTPQPAPPSNNAPSVPTSVAVTVGATAGAATLSWQAPVSIGSSALTGYFITRSGLDAAGRTFAPLSLSTSTLSYTWTGLTPGATYTLTVSAVNAAGSSSGATVLCTVPSSVTPVGSNLMTDQQASVETTDLSGFIVNGTGITISRDTTWAATGTASVRSTATSAAANTSGISIEKIPVTAGTTYRYAATLLRGTDKPIGVTIKWRDSNNNALSNTDLVTVTGATGSTNALQADGTAPTGAVYARVTVQFAATPVAGEYFNLDGNTFTVLTTGGGGAVTTPSKPELVSVQFGDTSATIQWSYPSAPVTASGFTVARDGVDSNGSGPYSINLGVESTQFTFTNLVKGSTYTFSVTAFNSAGSGPAYTITGTVPTGNNATYPSDSLYPGDTLFPNDGGDPGTVTVVPPNAPTSVTVSSVTTDRKPTLTWVAPTVTGGAAITGYYVNWRTSDGTTGVQQTLAANATTYTWTNAFASAATVTFSVSAINSAGTGAAGSVTYTFAADMTTGVPGAPATVSGTMNTDGSAVITWTAPTATNGSAITGYYAGRSGTDVNGSGPWTSALLPTSPTSFTFTNLVVGQSYTFTVQAVNASGTGTGRTFTGTVPAPAATTTVSVAAATQGLNVSWTLPTGTASSTVSRNGTDLSGAGAFTSASLGNTVNTYSFTNLDPTQTYTITVRVTLGSGTVVTGTGSGKPLAPSAAGTNPLGLKAFTAGASVTGAAAGEFNKFAGGKRVTGLTATWGQNDYWRNNNAGKVWSLVNGADGEYSSQKTLSVLGRYDFDIAPQFGVQTTNGNHVVTAGGWATAANDMNMKAWLIDQWNELKTYMWHDNTQRIYIRPYHEFNGNWYQGWEVTSAQDAANFVLHWRNVIYPAFQTVFGSDPRVLLEWCPNRDSSYSSKYQVTAAYPGAAYVDVHGVDYYDFGFQSGVTITDAMWTSEINATQNGAGGLVGLQTHLNFANQNGKALLLPEMGQQFHDQPGFLTRLSNFALANAYSGTGSPAGKILGLAYHNLRGQSPDPNAGGDFFIESGGGIYSNTYTVNGKTETLRPNASAVWQNFLKTAALRTV